MDFVDYLRRMPKVELHIHLNGTIRAQTVLDLAKKNDVPFPATDPGKVYHFPYTAFFRTLQRASEVVKTHEDFARIAYECLEDSARYSNVKYQELFLNPTLFVGVPYSTVLQGVVEGVRAAQDDHDIEARLIPCIYRGDAVQAAQEMLDEVIAHREPEVIGIGLDGLESHGPPEKFVSVFRHAADAGLRRTAHAGEDGPPENIVTCLDVLNCDRIDHGYAVLEQPRLVRRMREEGVFFNVIIRAWAKYTGFEHHPVKEMDKQGIRITIGSDDPPMQHGDLGLEWVDAAVAFNWGPDKVRSLSLDSIEATWLDAGEKQALRARFEGEFAQLDSEPLEHLPPAFLPYFRGRWWSRKDEVAPRAGRRWL